MEARGIRNYNPGNIRGGSEKWQGEVGRDDKGFVIFDSERNGLRALAKVLINYQLKHNLQTIRQIVTRWAPPNENNTVAYINAVAGDMHTSADAPLNVRDPETLDQLVRAIVLHEVGSFPYTARTLVTASNDALGKAA